MTAGADTGTEPPARADGRTTRYADHRRRLLDGAIAYVLEHGVSGLRMRPLAEALGVSPAALLNHFGSKEGLVDEVLESFRAYSIAVARRQEEQLGTGPGWAAYDRWFENWTDDAILPAVRLVFECYALGFRDPDRYGAALRHTIDDWLAFPRPFLRSLGCPDDQLDAYASLMFATMSGLQLDLLASGDRERVTRAHRTFVALLETARAGWAATR